MPYTIAIAGTTQRTVMCAQALLQHHELEISLVITPAPQRVGRDRKLTKNDVQNFANSNQVPTVLIKNKIDEEVKKKINEFAKPDFLLVVDFGYLVPEWLLDLPKIMPLNIHPSALPKWRGSSPGQFVLLSGEKESAVTIIQMTPQFDQGPIIWQQKFTVDQSWTQTQYYQFSFELICQKLSKILLQLAEGKITPRPQPATSPTPLARRLTKQDAFVTW
ncbi:methionyl-tRNA formyltransferase [Patescibacteria group bacterium]|nr:methionyl-tRNA formyltransferase [Patescibacteria group bacterium]